MPIDVRRETNHIWNEYTRYRNQVGEEVIWFQFSVDDSRYDDVYDEGGKTYKTGIRMPVLWVDQIEDPEQYSSEGRRPTQRIRFAISAREMQHRGIDTREAHGKMFDQVPPVPPIPSQYGRPESPWLDDRLNDVIYYDRRFYTISNFQIRGRAKFTDIIIGVSGLETTPDDESIYDLFPWNTTFGGAVFESDPVTVLDLSMEVAQEAEYLIQFEDTDLTGSTWDAVIKSGDQNGSVVATFDINTDNQADGFVTIVLTEEEAQALELGGQYVWSMTQNYQAKTNIVFQGSFEVLEDQ